MRADERDLIAGSRRGRGERRTAVGSRPAAATPDWPRSMLPVGSARVRTVYATVMQTA
jgi:hypothetical protein